MQLRQYDPADQERCLAIFDSNVPLFFGSAERPQFESFLVRLPGRYFVVEEAPGGEVLACGGYVEDEPGEIVLTWGMVDRAHHRQGIGRFLLVERLAELAAVPDWHTVRIDTSQHTSRFFERFSFSLTEVEPDRFGPGLDAYTMILPLDEFARMRIREWQAALPR